MGTIRSFIAIELTAEIKEKLREAQSLFYNISGKFNWIRPEQMHITLRFLGSVPEGNIEKIAEAMEKATKGISPFIITCMGLGCFPNPDYPRILWVGLEYPATLRQLQKRLEKELVDIGFEEEQRDFVPHLTIARIKSRPDMKRFKNVLQANKNIYI